MGRVGNPTQTYTQITKKFWLTRPITYPTLPEFKKFYIELLLILSPKKQFFFNSGKVG